MTATLFHALKTALHVPESEFQVTPLDVRKVLRIKCRKRLFCIYDQEYPYSLEIEYVNPQIGVPVCIPGKPFTGVGIHETYSHYKTITCRYKTEQDAQQEMNDIAKLQNIMEQYDQVQNMKENEKLAEFIKTLP